LNILRLTVSHSFLPVVTHIYRHQSTTIMPRPRAKKSNKATAPLHSSSREVIRMIRPSPRVSHAGSSESSADAYTNSRDPIDDSDLAAEVLDQDSIPDVFKAKKKVRSSHIWLPENGIECVVDGVDRWKS